MFQNRSLRVSLDRNPSQSAQPTPPVDRDARRADLEANINLVSRHARSAAVGGIGVYAAVKTIKTLSEIAINIAPKN